MQGERSVFDQAYDRNVRLTKTIINSSGAGADSQATGYTTSTDPSSYDALTFTDIGKTLTRNLASTNTSVLFPARVHWALVDMTFKDPDRQKSTRDQEMLSRAQVRMMRRFDQMRGKSQMNRAIQEVFDGGQLVLHASEADDNGPDRFRMFPLKKIGVERRDGHVTKVIVQETQIGLSPEGRIEYRPFWTRIDYLARTITQELPNGEIKEAGDAVRRWLVLTSEAPQCGSNYAPAFNSHHICTLEQLNVYHGASRDIAGEAALIVKAIRKGSGLSQEDVAGWSGPIAVEMVNPERDLQFLSAGVKLNDWVALDTKIERIEAELKKDYLHGLLERRPRMETATEVREVVEEMNAIGAHFYAHFQDNLQLPLAWALLDLEGISFESGDKGEITPTILTGISSLTQQESAERLIGLLKVMAEFDEEFVRQVPSIKIFRRLASAYHIETDDLVPTDRSAFDLLRELAQQIEQNPAEVVPLLVQFVQQFVPELAGQMQPQSPATMLASTMLQQAAGGGGGAPTQNGQQPQEAAMPT